MSFKIISYVILGEPMNKPSLTLDSYPPTSPPPTQPPYNNLPTELNQSEQYPDRIIEDITTQRSDQEPERPAEPSELPDKLEERPLELPEIPEEPPERPENLPERPEDFTERTEESTERPDEPIVSPDDSTENPEEPSERPEEPTERPEEPAEIPEEPTKILEEPTKILEKQVENPEEPNEKLEISTEIPEESQRFDLTEMPYTSRTPEYNTMKFKESNEYRTTTRRPNISIPPRPVEEFTSEPPFKQSMKIIPHRSLPNKTVINRKQEVIKESRVYIDSDFQQILSNDIRPKKLL